jgi:release factor glutamine methyltransferase
MMQHARAHFIRVGGAAPPAASRSSARASRRTPSRGDPPLAATFRNRPAKPLMRKLWRKWFQLRLALLDRRKYERVVLEHLAGLPIVVLPDVFNPKLLRSGEFLVQQLGRLQAGCRVLDLGSGSGAAGVVAAKRGAHVVAVDINPAAVRCTRVNALLNDVALDTRQGDLFAPVQGERFDVVLFNPPYYRGAPRDALDHAWRSPDVIERFSRELADHLTPTGLALLVLSSDGEHAAFLDALGVNGFTASPVAERDFRNEQMTVYKVQRC